MKKVFLIILVSLLSLLHLYPFIGTDFPVTHDAQNHLFRIANYRIALKEGQIPPRFAPNLLNGYGYPVFNYNYPLTNILSVPFSILKLHPELTLKILFGFFTVTGMIGVYSLARVMKYDYISSLFALSLFATSPFLFSTIVYRGNIGELMAIALMPWVLWSLVRLKNYQGISLSFIVFLTLFALSHNLTVVFSIPIFLLFGVILFGKEKAHWITLLKNIVVSTTLVTWFWIPAIFEQSQVVVSNASLVSQFSQHFLNFGQLLFSPLTFGFSFPGFIDSLSLQIGLPLIMIFLFGVILFIKEKRLITSQKMEFSFLIIIFATLFGTVVISSIFWETFTFLKILQFPWRLHIFSTLFISCIGAFVWKNTSNSLRIFLSIIILIQCLILFRQKPIGYFHNDKSFYDKTGQSSSTQNENVAKTFTYSDISDWKPSPQVLRGEGEITVNTWNGTVKKYTINATTEVLVVEPTMNFLGWETHVSTDGVRSKVSYENSEDIKGRISYILPAGSHTIQTVFTQRTPARLLGNSISFIGLLILFILMLKRKFTW